MRRVRQLIGPDPIAQARREAKHKAALEIGKPFPIEQPTPVEEPELQPAPTMPAAAAQSISGLMVGRADSTDRRNTMLAYRATPETDPALPDCDTRGVQFRSPVPPETRDLASLFSTMLVAQPGQA